MVLEKNMVSFWINSVHVKYIFHKLLLLWSGQALDLLEFTVVGTS